jgi:hypothetical protein
LRKLARALGVKPHLLLDAVDEVPHG